MKNIITLFVFVAFTLGLKAQMNIDEAQAKFIYNFTKFFDWPQSEKTGDFVIGVLGDKSLSNEISNITNGKKNGYQNIVVQYFRNYNEVDKCHVLFISSYDVNKISTIHEKTGLYTLIISDSMKGIQSGAAINFAIINNRLKYEFSKDNALKHGLKFHSKIAEMAYKNH